MDRPIIVDNKPMPVTLVKGKKYFFCTCGRSDKQPFCDGSHAGTTLTPKAFTAEREKAYLCACKKSENTPFCDGSHNRISDTQVGEEG